MYGANDDTLYGSSNSPTPLTYKRSRQPTEFLVDGVHVPIFQLGTCILDSSCSALVPRLCQVLLCLRHCTGRRRKRLTAVFAYAMKEPEHTYAHENMGTTFGQLLLHVAHDGFALIPIPVLQGLSLYAFVCLCVLQSHQLASQTLRYRQSIHLPVQGSAIMEPPT